MRVKVMIPTPLRRFTGEQAAVEVTADTVGQALANLTEVHTGLRKHLYSDQGALRNYVNVYLNEEDVRYLQKDATLLKDGDTLSIVPSIAGGAS